MLATCLSHLGYLPPSREENPSLLARIAPSMLLLLPPANRQVPFGGSCDNGPHCSSGSGHPGTTSTRLLPGRSPFPVH